MSTKFLPHEKALYCVGETLCVLTVDNLYRNVLGTKCLADILSEREKIANWMEQTLGNSLSEASRKILITSIQTKPRTRGELKWSEQKCNKNELKTKIISKTKNISPVSKDVRLPVQLQRAMAAEAEAAREARAKVSKQEKKEKLYILRLWIFKIMSFGKNFP